MSGINERIKLICVLPNERSKERLRSGHEYHLFLNGVEIDTSSLKLDIEGGEWAYVTIKFPVQSCQIFEMTREEWDRYIIENTVDLLDGSSRITLKEDAWK